MKKIKTHLQSQASLKQIVWKLLVHPRKDRPRFWLRMFQFFYLKRGKGSVIYRSVRKDLFPWQPFQLGNYSIVEDYSTLANAMGEIGRAHV